MLGREGCREIEENHGFDGVTDVFLSGYLRCIGGHQQILMIAQAC